MDNAGTSRSINFVKVGALAAFLLAATLITANVIFVALSSNDPRTDTRKFLDDVVDQRSLALAAAWLQTFAGLLTVSVFLGLYYGMRRWGEDHMRLATVAGVVAAVMIVLVGAHIAAFAGSVIPAWHDAGDGAARANVLSDAHTLSWLIDAIFSAFAVTIAIGTLAASLVMLRAGGVLWRVVAWIGIVGAIVGFAAAFSPASSGLGIASAIHGILSVAWLLGVGVALWRLPPGEKAAA